MPHATLGLEAISCAYSRCTERCCRWLPALQVFMQDDYAQLVDAGEHGAAEFARQQQLMGGVARLRRLQGVPRRRWAMLVDT